MIWGGVWPVLFVVGLLAGLWAVGALVERMRVGVTRHDVAVLVPVLVVCNLLAYVGAWGMVHP